MRKIRNSLSQNEVMQKSLEILNRFVCSQLYKSSAVIMLYLSAKNEADTLKLAEKALADGKKVVVPITDTKTNTLTLSYITSLDKLREGAFGILEPEIVIPCDYNDIDTVIVPGLVFDERGGRIGYGKGYYDRLFSKLNAVKAAFCYDFQLVPAVYTESHDVPMDYIITESRIIDCD